MHFGRNLFKILPEDVPSPQNLMVAGVGDLLQRRDDLAPYRPGKAAPIRLRLRTGTVAVRQGIPAFQPAGGAHIRDGACALGPCPWEVPMQSPKPKAARSLLPAAFDGTIIALSNGTL